MSKRELSTQTIDVMSPVSGLKKTKGDIIVITTDKLNWRIKPVPALELGTKPTSLFYGEVQACVGADVERSIREGRAWKYVKVDPQKMKITFSNISW